MNLAKQIAAEIEEQIKQELLLAGVKLPSVRSEAERRNISPTTMVEAYDLLRTRCLIETRPRRGYFVMPPQSGLSAEDRKPNLLPSSSIEPAALLQDMLAAGNDDRIFPFGAAIPYAGFYPLQKLKKLMQSTLKDKPELLGAYRFSPGSEALRQSLALRYQRFGVKVNAKAVVTTTGAIEAIGLALRAIAEPGEIVGIETPTYPGIFQLVRSLGYRILEIPLDPIRGLSPEAMKAAITKARGKLKAIVTVSNFSNPLGTLVSDVDKKALVALAYEHALTLVEDDIYGDLSFSRQRPRPLKAFDTHDQVILCTSFSKTISPSLRSGCVISSRHSEKLSALKYARGSGISAFNEEVLHRFLAQGNYDRHLNTVRAEYRTLIARYSQLILKHFPEGTRLSQPEGGHILWVELPHDIDGGIIQKKALKQHISVAPGSIFSEGGLQYRNFIRLNCAIPWSSASQTALKKIGKLICT